MCGSIPFFPSFRRLVASCDDVGSAAARSLVDPRDLEGDGDERPEHDLGERASDVGDVLSEDQFKKIHLNSERDSAHAPFTALCTLSPCLVVQGSLSMVVWGPEDAD